MIENEQDMLDHLSAESVEQAEKHVYKYTSCGAWIKFNPGGIEIGSIVEGCDSDCESYTLNYPFDEETYDERIQDIEAEADSLWEWANAEQEDGQTAAEAGVDPPTL